MPKQSCRKMYMDTTLPHFQKWRGTWGRLGWKQAEAAAKKSVPTKHSAPPVTKHSAPPATKHWTPPVTKQSVLPVI